MNEILSDLKDATRAGFDMGKVIDSLQAENERLKDELREATDSDYQALLASRWKHEADQLRTRYELLEKELEARNDATL